MVPMDDGPTARPGCRVHLTRPASAGPPSRARPRPPVAERLLASWRRSEDYGVPLESVRPVFAGAGDQHDSLFFQCGHEVLTSLHRTLVDEPISLMLTDADGLVLNRLER